MQQHLTSQLIERESLVLPLHFEEYYRQQPYSKTPILKCVSLESLNGRIYCIDPTPDKGGIFFREKDSNNKYGEFDIIKVKDRKTHWPQAFLLPRTGR
jgi:hypothetical protein